MQQRIRRIASPVLVAATIGGIIWVSAGDLNPPAGPVTPTMKTLAEVEPRTAVNAINTPGDATALFNITQVGSYYLTGNIAGVAGKSGIRISSDHVTLDLNGFTMDGAGVGPRAIQLDFVQEIVVRNGIIANWTSESIIGEETEGMRIENIRLRNIPGDNLLVGSRAVVVDCSANSCLLGFQIGAESQVKNCSVTGITHWAISVGPGSLVEGCMLNFNGVGIRVSGPGSVVRNNVINGSASDGILVIGGTSSNNRIEDNHVTGGGVGIRITHAGNYVADNTVKGNTDNYDFVEGNQLNILLCEIPESIDWSATVTLAGSLTGSLFFQNGITVNADNVTIDLNGFALIGALGSLDGIAVPVGQKNLTVRNGTIRDWGSQGVNARLASNSQLQGLRVSDNGSYGLWIGNGSLVTQCTARDNSNDGIRVSTGCIVQDCSANFNDGDGIRVSTGCIVQDCSANSNDGDGIIASTGSTVVGCTARTNTNNGISTFCRSTVTNCTATDNDDDGIHAGAGSTVTNCTAGFNTGDGIQISSDCRVVGNACDNNGFGGGDGAGIHATDSDNRIEGNSVTDNDSGIDVDVSGNIIIKNTASGNTTNYDIVAGNTVGDILDFTAGPGGTITSGNPWANFEH